MSPRATLRLIGGLLVAALWLPALLYIVSRGWEREFSFLIVAYYTIPLTLLVAGPLVYIQRKKLTLVRCLTVGLLLGTLGAFTFWSPYSLKAMFNWGPVLMFVGVISSLLFWVVSVWRNRDLTAIGAGRGR
jgi:hypothetical protein